MKVLHILNKLMPSGAEKMLSLAAPHWQKEKFDLSILATGQTIGSYHEELENAGFQIHHIPFSKSIRFIYRVFKLIKRYHFDVVHIHTERVFFLYAILAWLNHTPAIIRTIHSNFRFTGFTKYYRRKIRKLLHLLEVQQVSIGRSVHDNELQRFGNKTIIINNWCDLGYLRPPTKIERLETRRSHALSNHKVIISIGNCSSVKNHDLILKALNMLKSDVDNLVYLHIGEEDHELSERNLAEELGISDMVRFCGWQKDIRPFLWVADIYVMPSLYEGFGIAALEAIASGLPVILTDVPGLREWKYFNMKSIQFIEPTAEELAGKLIEVLRAPTFPTENELQGLRNSFIAERGAKEYLRLYKQSFHNKY